MAAPTTAAQGGAAADAVANPKLPPESSLAAEKSTASLVAGGAGSKGGGAADEFAALGKARRPPRTREQKEARAEWREKLAAFFSIRAPTKTQKDVDNILDHFEPPNGPGWAAMWAEATKRYGDEPPEQELEAARRRMRWFAKFVSFYALVDPAKTQEEIVSLMSAATMKGREYEDLWARVQEKYGVYIDRQHPAEAAAVTRPTKPGTIAGTLQAVSDTYDTLEYKPSGRQARFDEVDAGGSPSPIRPRGFSDNELLPESRGRTIGNPTPGAGARHAVPLREGQLQQRQMLVVILSDVWYKLYRVAGSVAQQRFRDAVAVELASNTNLHDRVSIVRISDHVDGVVVEADIELPSGWSAQGTAVELIRKVANGECTVAGIRQAYAENLGGNAQRVFITDAAVVEYFTSPGLRYNVAINNRAAGEDLASPRDERQPRQQQPLGVRRDDFGEPPSASSRAAAAAAAAARDSVVYPRGAGSSGAAVVGTRPTTTSPPNRNIPHNPEAIVEPTVVSDASDSPPRPHHAAAQPRAPVIPEYLDPATNPLPEHNLHFDADGNRIPEWDIIPRQPYPKALDGPTFGHRGAPHTPQSRRQGPATTPSRTTFDPAAYAGRGGVPPDAVPSATTTGQRSAALPSSFMQVAQRVAPGPHLGADALTPSQQAHLRRGGATPHTY